MEDTLYEAVMHLKETLNHDPRVVDLKEKEALMEKDEQAMAASYRFSMASDEYQRLSKYFSETSPEVQNAQHEMYLKKKALDEVPSVEAYRKSYAQVAKLYLLMNQLIFQPFQNACTEQK